MEVGADVTGEKDKIFVKFECENMLRTVIKIIHAAARHPFVVASNPNQSV